MDRKLNSFTYEPNSVALLPSKHSGTQTAAGTKPTRAHGYSQPPSKDVAATPHISWYKPVSMLCLFLIGVGSAIGHHVFYSKLNQSEANHQEWTSRTGTALAFLFGFSLAALVEISRDQWIWHTLRSRFISLKGIDAIFGLSSNLFNLFNYDMVRYAKVLTLMGLVKWAFPLSTIFTPGTISVVPSQHVTYINCTVPILKFDYDKSTNSTLVRPPNEIQTDRLYQTTGRESGISPSARAAKVFKASLASGGVLSATNITSFKPLLQNCNDNCAYTIQFEGPTIQCTNATPSHQLTGDDPWANLTNSSECDSTSGENIPEEMVIFGTGGYYPRFWSMYTVPKGPNSRIICRQQYGVECRAAVAKYTVSQALSGNVFLTPKISAVDFLYYNVDQPDNSNYSMDAQFFNTVITALGGGMVLTYNSGDTEESNKNISSQWTEVDLTSLVTLDGQIVHPLAPSIELLSNHMIVSLLSDPYFYYAAETTTTCTLTKDHNIYRYKPFVLATTYASAIGISGLMAGLGFIALFWNGVSSDVSYSTILRTTRNPTLDRELKDECFGGHPLPKELGKLRLKFGELPHVNEKKTDAKLSHVGMGIEGKDDVLPIPKQVGIVKN